MSLIRTLGQSDTASVSVQRDKMARALAAIRSAPSRGIGLGTAYPTTSDAPTVSYSTAATVTTNPIVISSSNYTGTAWTPLGCAAMSWDTSYYVFSQKVNGNSASPLGFGFTLTGTEVEIGWRASGTPEAQWIWVDGKPVTSAPAAPSGITVTQGSTYYTKLVFATSGVRRIEFYSSLGQLANIRTNAATSTISPLPAKSAAKLFALGDSYLGGSNLIPSLQTWGRRIGFATGMELFQGGQGGTGYYGAGPATPLNDPSRLAPVSEVDPDLCVIFIGGNDASVNPASVGSAASSVYSTIRASRPAVPIVVVGTYVADASSALDTGRAAVNKAIRDAALAAPNVIGFIDPIGNADTGTVPPAFVSGQAYAVGDRFSYNGSIYQHVVAGTSYGSPDPNWTKCLTWVTGTGSAASPKGDGSRDTLIAGDGAHWTLAGAGVQAQRIMQGVEQILASALTSK